MVDMSLIVVLQISDQQVKHSSFIRGMSQIHNLAFYCKKCDTKPGLISDKQRWRAQPVTH